MEQNRTREYRPWLIEYKNHLVEATFVVFGVVLALMANEWRQNRADQVHARTARESIVAELKTNRDAVAESAAYHKELYSALMPFRRSGEPVDITIFRKGFIHPANTFSTAWSAARNTGALRNMEYQEVLRFSRIYAQQERYERQQDLAGNSIYSRLLEGGAKSLVQKAEPIQDVVGGFLHKEMELVKAYDSALAELQTALAHLEDQDR